MTDTHSDSPRKSYRLPFTVPTWLIYLMVFMVVASWIPLAVIARKRASFSPKPRIHIFQDMDVQPRFGPQSYAGAASPQLGEHYGDLFLDKRGMRPHVPGTIAREAHAGPMADDHYYRGYKTDENLEAVMIETPEGKGLDFIGGFPKQIEITPELLQRGRERFGIYCALCHGEAGYGDGPVERRIATSKSTAGMIGAPDPAAGWAVPRNLHQQGTTIAANIAHISEGRLFHVITDGVGKMQGYKTQIPVADRWAIVAYIKALQASQNVSLDYAKNTLGMSSEAIDKLVAAAGPKPEKMKAASNEDELVAQGKALFTAKICMTCHDTPTSQGPAGAALKAPRFVGKFWGEKVIVTEGPGGPEKEVVFDEAYVAESIEFPMKLIHKGSIPGMAPLPTTPDERKALAAYLKSLSE